MRTHACVCARMYEESTYTCVSAYATRIRVLLYVLIPLHTHAAICPHTTTRIRLLLYVRIRYMCAHIAACLCTYSYVLIPLRAYAKYEDTYIVV